MYITVHHHDHTFDVSVLLLNLHICTYFIGIQPEDKESSSSDINNKCKANFIGYI